MVPLRAWLVLACAISQSLSLPSATLTDPCVIGAQKWASPSDVRACYRSYPFNETIRQNTIDVMEKLLPFHPSISFQVQAPEPFSKDVRVDLYAELDRMRHQLYDTDFDFNLDMGNTFSRSRDFNFKYVAWCYDLRYTTVLPTPVVLITEDTGEQAVYIAPEAFEVASGSFSEQIPVWQAALPNGTTLESLSGAKVLTIDGKEPFDIVDASAELNGDYESLSTRQNAFFGSYSLVPTDPYYFGDFAVKTLPLADNVTLVVQRQNSFTTDTVTLPYRSYVNDHRKGFNDSESFFAQCFHEEAKPAVMARDNLRGQELVRSTTAELQSSSPSKVFPRWSPESTNLTLVANFSYTQIYTLEDRITGVLAIGRFRPTFQDPRVQKQVLDVFQSMKEKGVKQLIIDVTNGWQGRTCTAAFFHRLFSGAGPKTIPQAGLDFRMRAGPLAKLMVQKLAEGGDARLETEYNSENFLFANQTRMPKGYNYMADTIEQEVNGNLDFFTQRMSPLCPNSDVKNSTTIDLPDTPLFDLKNVVILTNGRAITASALFTTLMANKEGVRTVVAGGRADVPQQSCGSMGPWSFGSWPIFNYLKELGLENHPLAPKRP